MQPQQSQESQHQADLGTILENLNSEDGTRRQQAEQWLAAAEQQPQTLIPGLIEQGIRNTNTALAQLGFVLLRQQFKKSTNPWKHLPESTQNQVKEQLLHALGCTVSKQQGHVISHAIAELVSTIACEGQKWEGALNFVPTLLQDKEEIRREVGGFLLSKIAEYAGEEVLASHADELWPTINKLLNDSSVLVAARGIQSACFLVLSLDPNSQARFTEAIPRILKTLERVLASDEEIAQESLQTFTELAKQAPSLFREYLNVAQDAMLFVVKRTEFDDSIRQTALELIIELCEEGGGMVRKNKRFVEHAVVAATNLIAEVEDDDQWSNSAESTKTFTGDGEEEEMSMLGEEALDRVINSIGAKTCLPYFLNHLGTLLNGDWKYRRAALVGLSLVGPASSKEMHSQLRMITEKVVTYFSDPEPRVRNAAVYCIRELALGFSDMGKKKTFQQMTHDVVVPSLNSLLSAQGASGGIERLRSAAASAYSAFLTPHACKRRHLGNIKQFLQLLVELLEHSRFLTSKENAMTAIAAASTIATKEFTEFYDNFMSIAKCVFENAVQASQTDGSSVSLKNRSLECIALICSSVGSDQAREDAHQVMQILVNNPSLFDTDDSESYQYLTAACVRLGKTLGNGVASYLSVLLPPLARTAMQEIPLTAIDADDEKLNSENSRYAAVSVEVVGEGTRVLAVDSSALQDKCTAASMLFHYVESLSTAAVLPYLDTIAEPLLKGISETQIQNLRVTCLCSASPILRCALKDRNDVSRAQRYAEDIIGRLCESIKKEQDREVVATATEVLAECVKLCKESFDANSEFCSQAAPPQTQWETLVDSISECIQTSKGQLDKATASTSQEDFDDEAAEQLEESCSTEEEILTSLIDCVGFFVKLYGNTVLPYLSRSLLPNLLPWLDKRKRHEAVLLSSALCCCEDIIEYCGEEANELAAKILPYCFENLNHERGSVQQSAAYGIGIVAKLKPQYMPAERTEQAFSALTSHVREHSNSAREDNGEMEAAMDNVVAALFKIAMYRMPELGFQSQIPHAVDLVIQYLPIKQDTIEGRELHQWLLESIIQHSQIIFATASMTVCTLARKVYEIGSLHYEKLTEELAPDEERDYILPSGTENLVTQSLQSLKALDDNQFEQACNSVDTEDRSAVEALAKLVQSR
eukprot:gb/GECG01013010.1/.p1 GENE.gb/GECG01013010.1/~~gb/GECG01013010.1/.p1  ORF type:complete len:1159 (+),score=165.77 gb/GECG01013010.1/:1-3477(+)